MATKSDSSLEERITKLLEGSESPDQISSTTKSPNFTIPRIPTSIRGQHDLYKPRMVAIGPYHNHEEDSFQDIELHKRRYLNEFLRRNNKDANADAVAVALQTYIDAIRSLKEPCAPHKCYRNWNGIHDDDEHFVQMMLFDGCFILELVLKLNDNENHRLCSAGWDFMTILSDLLLIENQIPFFVLEKLYATFKGPNCNNNSQVESSAELKSLVANNLFTYLGCTGVPLISRGKEAWNPPVSHLLHLYHEFSLLNTRAGNCNNGMIDEGKKRKDHRLPITIPSATQLLEFGFEITKQDSRHNCDAAIKHSTLKIPQLILDSGRRAILMNLLAFEQGLDDKSKSRWTGLMVMLNCIVKSKSDLEILRRNRVVINLLSNEDDAVAFFGHLGKHVVVDFSDHYYSDLVEQINDKCDMYFRKKRATIMHEYFNNRWALMSFVCSIFAITLSMVQTLVSVFTYRRRFL